MSPGVFREFRNLGPCSYPLVTSDLVNHRNHRKATWESLTGLVTLETRWGDEAKHSNCFHPPMAKGSFRASESYLWLFSCQRDKWKLEKAQGAVWYDVSGALRAKELGPKCFLPLVLVTRSGVISPFDMKWELYISWCFTFGGPRQEPPVIEQLRAVCWASSCMN